MNDEEKVFEFWFGKFYYKGKITRETETHFVVDDRKLGLIEIPKAIAGDISELNFGTAKYVTINRDPLVSIDMSGRDKYKFNLDPVRVPQKYQGKRSYKGPNKGKPSGNPLGKNPSDVWKIIQENWDEELWEIPNVKASHVEKTIHPTQYPIELIERLVLALTNEQDFIFDTIP